MALTGASSATVGYMAGGDTGSYVSDFQKITFSTETVASMPANRSHNGAYAAATGNSDAAYIAGGYGPPIISRCDKLTYSSETCERIPGANLSLNSFNTGATGNTTAGYYNIGESSSATTTVNKLTYSSETMSDVPGAYLNNARYSASGSGGRQFGNPAMAILPTPTPSSTVFASGPNNAYIGGGIEPGSTIVSTVDKLSYSTDTTARVPGANLDTGSGGCWWSC